MATLTRGPEGHSRSATARLPSWTIEVVSEPQPGRTAEFQAALPHLVEFMKSSLDVVVPPSQSISTAGR